MLATGKWSSEVGLGALFQPCVFFPICPNVRVTHVQLAAHLSCSFQE